jgi:transposase InsO family protein
MVRREARRLGIKIIRNPPSSPEKNGKVERMHQTIEWKCLWAAGIRPNNQEEANYQLTKYITWYNTIRKHQGYNMNLKTPKQKLEEWLYQALILTRDHLDYQEYADVNETMIRYKY